jgi:hypothetical protein
MSATRRALSFSPASLLIAKARAIASILIVVCLSACAGMRHAPETNMPDMSTRAQMDAFGDGMWQLHNGDIRLFARDLARRGATCMEGTSGLKRGEKQIRCTYFFCKGSSLQQLHWTVGNGLDPSGGGGEYNRRRAALGLPETIYISYYGWVLPGPCRNLAGLQAHQRKFVLGESLTASYTELKAY